MKRVILAAALVVAGCNPAQSAPAPDTTEATGKTLGGRATRVEIATMNASTAQLDLKLPGEVEGSRDAKLAAALGGYIEKVHIKSGDKVHKGQILALVDTATHSARRHQTTVELKAAKREHERAKAMGSVLPRAQLDAAASRHEAAKAAYRSAAVMVQRSVITAPFSGVVDQVDVEVGEVAAPGQPIIRLLRIAPAIVSVSLSDRDVLSMTPGLPATITTEARGAPIAGIVKRVHKAADLRTRSFIAEIEVPNEDRRLLPGMIATVQLKAGKASKQMVISQDWLVTKLDEVGVFLHRDGKAAWSKVTMGPIINSRVVIERGLEKGDELIITGHRELAEGDPLIVARRGVCCAEGRVTFE